MERKSGIDNQAKGIGRQIKGKYDEVVGAALGDTSREMKGKLNKNVGKVQEKLGQKQEERQERRDLDKRLP